MPFQIVRNNIADMEADAIVNSANPLPKIGQGCEFDIYTKAGARVLLDERKKIGEIKQGQAAYTGAFGLSAKYIIHTVACPWKGGDDGEEDILRSCYQNSLHLAEELSCESIAFPLLCTGVYGFPQGRGLTIALEEIEKFLLDHEMIIYMVVYNKEAFVLSQKILGPIEEYLDEQEAIALRDWKSRPRPIPPDIQREELDLGRPEGPYCSSKASSEKNSPIFSWRSAKGSTSSSLGSSFLNDLGLKGYLEQNALTFQERLFELMDERGMDDVTTYKRANLSRQVFANIRSNVHYQPKKKTAIALGLALQLNKAELEDLLARAGFALSPADRFDQIISYYVEHQIYDIIKINATLFDYDLPTLFQSK